MLAHLALHALDCLQALRDLHSLWIAKVEIELSFLLLVVQICAGLMIRQRIDLATGAETRAAVLDEED